MDGLNAEWYKEDNGMIQYKEREREHLFTGFRYRNAMRTRPLRLHPHSSQTRLIFNLRHYIC